MVVVCSGRKQSAGQQQPSVQPAARSPHAQPATTNAVDAQRMKDARRQPTLARLAILRARGETFFSCCPKPEYACICLLHTHTHARHTLSLPPALSAAFPFPLPFPFPFPPPPPPPPPLMAHAWDGSTSHLAGQAPYFVYFRRLVHV